MPYPRALCGPWIDAEDLLDCCPQAECLSAEQLDSAVLAASEYLFEKSARQFPGRCTATFRPCGAGPCLSAGVRESCSCRPLAGVELRLSVWPIIEVLQVRQDGLVLPSGAYRVDNRSVLVRVDGEGWPRCQDLTLPSSEEGTLEVTVAYGMMPPELGLRAARALACELAKSCIGTGECKLPVRARSVSRQGVSVSLPDTTNMPKGKVGLQEVDLFLESYNPLGLQSGPRVWSPDLHPRHRRVGT